MSGYIAGFNQPGYLPESDPEEFDNFDDAADWLIEVATKALEDDGASEEIVTHERDAIGELADEGEPFSFLASDGYAYWVAEADDNAESGAWESLDDDEDDEDDDDWDDLDDEDDDS